MPNAFITQPPAVVISEDTAGIVVTEKFSWVRDANAYAEALASQDDLMHIRIERWDPRTKSVKLLRTVKDEPHRRLSAHPRPLPQRYEPVPEPKVIVQTVVQRVVEHDPRDAELLRRLVECTQLLIKLQSVVRDSLPLMRALDKQVRTNRMTLGEDWRDGRQ